MIVSCPNCQTRYRVDLAVLGSGGRQVRCRRCRHVWRQAPQAPKPQKAAAPKKKAPPPPPPPPPREEPEEIHLHAEADGMTEEPLPIVPEEDAFEAFRARRKMQLGEDFMPTMARRGLYEDSARPPLGKRLAMGGLALLLIALAAGGYLFVAMRDPIARAVPETAALYAGLAKSLDMPDLAVNVRGLAFVGVKQSRSYDGTDAVLSASGTIVNVTAGEIEVPQIKIALHDESRHQIMAQLVKPQADKLAPNMSTRFGARIAKVPEAAKFVEWSFARPEDLSNAAAAEKPGKSDKQEQPAHAEAAQHGE